ncbi:MAG: DUF6152 family protein [Gammaproteobacteria bacterium]|nr:DUF6152 family protein [Gammaproteobacteria bacterium]
MKAANRQLIQMTNFAFSLLLIPLMILFSAVGWAHHGNFTYDGSTVITIEGEVLVFNWTNPHSILMIQTDNGDEIEIEIDGPSLIRPMGVNSDSLKPGERIIAYVSPSNRGRSDEVLGREIIKEDGSLIRVSVAFARQQARENLLKADSVLGSWVPDRTNLFTHVASSASWQLTQAGQALFDSYDSSVSFAQAECLSATAPTLMMYPTVNFLTQVNGYIEINADWMGASRTVYMDGRDHPVPETSYYQGHSIGHWEDDDLVIETTNFTENSIGNVFSIASGVSKKIVERISLNNTGSTATYSFTLTDPDYLAAPVAASYEWHYRPDVSVSSEACDLEVARRYLEE